MLSPKAKAGTRPLPYLRNRDVQWGRFELDDLPEMDFTEEEALKFSLVDGDIVVCEGGETGRAAIWRQHDREIKFQKALHRVRCSERLLPEYFVYLLRHYSSTGKFDALVTGTTISHLPQEVFRNLAFPLPPIEEQRRIVATIEEQFSCLDATSATLETVSRLGKALIERRYAFLLESGYERVPLADIAQTSSGGTPSRKATANYGGSIPWIKSGELGDGIVNGTEESITELGLQSSSAKLLQRGTLLMAMYGATIGKLGIVGMDVAATNQAVCAIRPYDPDLIPWLWLCLRAMRPGIIAAGKGGAQPNISQGIIRDLEVPLPELSERQRITGELEHDRDRIDWFLSVVRAQSARLRALRAALLHRAFGAGAA